MKLVTWNCQGAFRKKAAYVMNLEPDILVVQECEHPDKLGFGSLNQKPNDFFWHGDNIHKGIGIYSYSDFKFELLPTFNPQFRYVLPFRASGYGQEFILFAIWAMNNKENFNARYIGQIWLAINYYSNMLDHSTILVGDFNSNKIWDYKDRVGNHSDVVRMLAKNEILSIYHKKFDCEQGKEKHPTFFLQRNQTKSYHIDYCFASKDIIDNVIDVEIGDYESWIGHSDHSPLTINFNF